MKEILFRGKQVDTNEWVYGYYACRYRVLNGEFHMIAYRDFEHPSKLLYSEIDPETVGQFTGLYDADRNRIFEGDIIKGKGKELFLIEYNEDISSYVARALSGTLYTPSLNTGTMKGYRVVGNLWDNPELMAPGEQQEEMQGVI